MGNCAALSFLQNIQELITSEIGVSNATLDISKVSRLEEVEHQDFEFDSESVEGDVPGDINELEELLDVFFTSVPTAPVFCTSRVQTSCPDANLHLQTCGILDIFDYQHAQDLLKEWVEDVHGFDNASKAVLFLVLASAAQSRSAGVEDQHRAQYFFRHGRHTALLKLTDEPRLETVHAFILISLYMLASSERNAAHLNLGIAISAAKSLGIHRSTSSIERPGTESRSR